MHAYEATLEVVNPLSFRTNEYGNIIRTSRILHNWALRFALNGISGNPEKTHLENLQGTPIYATPAVPIEIEYEFQTFHPFPEAPQLLKNPGQLTSGSRRTYQGDYTILHFKEVIRPNSSFRFAVASLHELPQNLLITYGGKRTLQKVIFQECSITESEPINGDLTHPVNPLDFSNKIQFTNAFEYSIPPSPLFEGTVSGSFIGRRIRRGSNEYVVPSEW